MWIFDIQCVFWLLVYAFFNELLLVNSYMSCAETTYNIRIFLKHYSDCFSFSSYQISQRVFEQTRKENSTDILKLEVEALSGFDAFKKNFVKKDGRSVPFELYKRRTSAFVRRETFLDIACDALAEYKYVGPNQRADLVLACRYCVVYVYSFMRAMIYCNLNCGICSLVVESIKLYDLIGFAMVPFY